jgi:hypothetical protein
MKTRMLFAVVALAGGCEKTPAPNPTDPPLPPTPVENAHRPWSTDEVRPPPPMPAARPPAVARPRTTANGRPACGNVASRSAVPCEQPTGSDATTTTPPTTTTISTTTTVTIKPRP